jgi:hypothetical protein
VVTSARQSSVATARLTALIGGVLVCARGVADPDLWGHLRFGLDLLRDRRISTTDPYSFTQDMPWINHEWLSELLFAIAYRVGGIAGLIVLKTAVIAMVLTLAWATLRPISRASWRWWLLAVVPFALTPAASTFRPQLWTLLAVMLLVRTMSTGRGWWLVVPLFGLWANLHGGWIVGFGLMAAWLAGKLLDDARPRDLVRSVTTLVLGLCATLMNPYGTRLWGFLAGTVRMTREITEWRPLWQQADWSHAVLWTISACLCLAALRASRNRRQWAPVLPACGLGVASLFVDRLGPLFALVSTPLWAHAWSEASASDRQPRGYPQTTLIVDMAAVASIWILVTAATVRCLPISGSWAPDLLAASALESSTARGRLVLPFDWGEYAIWHWGPRLRVSMDGRRETVYSHAMLDLQDAVTGDQRAGVDYLLREKPDYVWLKTSADVVRNALDANGYRIDVSTPASFVAVREDKPALSLAEPLVGCFP